MEKVAVVLTYVTVWHAAEKLYSIRQLAQSVRCQLRSSDIGDADQQSACSG